LNLWEYDIAFGVWRVFVTRIASAISKLDALGGSIRLKNTRSRRVSSLGTRGAGRWGFQWICGGNDDRISFKVSMLSEELVSLEAEWLEGGCIPRTDRLGTEFCGYAKSGLKVRIKGKILSHR
jgi:hypothetical protein